MKRKLLIALGVMLALPTFARDFTYKYEGKTLTYTVIDEEAKTVCTKPGKAGVPGNYVAGELNIPSIAVDENNVSYTVVSIGDYSFAGPNSLTAVTIPNSVITIGECAFFDGTELSSVTIGNSVQTICHGAFSWSGLTSLTIPNSVKTIEKYAFTYCGKLGIVTIPASVTSFGEGIFLDSYGVRTIYYNAINPVEGPKDIFTTYNDSRTVLYGPAEAVEKCKSINPWMNFKKIEAYDFSQSAVDEIMSDEDWENMPMYDLYGRKISEPQKGQIYVKGGKKFMQN